MAAADARKLAAEVSGLQRKVAESLKKRQEAANKLQADLAKATAECTQLRHQAAAAEEQVGRGTKSWWMVGIRGLPLRPLVVQLPMGAVPAVIWPLHAGCMPEVGRAHHHCCVRRRWGWRRSWRRRPRSVRACSSASASWRQR